jgi:hypothetical protein
VYASTPHRCPQFDTKAEGFISRGCLEKKLEGAEGLQGTVNSPLYQGCADAVSAAAGSVAGDDIFEVYQWTRSAQRGARGSHGHDCLPAVAADTRAHALALALTHTLTHTRTHTHARTGAEHPQQHGHFLYAAQWESLWGVDGRLSFADFVYIFSSWIDFDADEGGGSDAEEAVGLPH